MAVVKTLLAAGALLDALDADQQTPYGLYNASGREAHEELIAMLNPAEGRAAVKTPSSVGGAKGGGLKSRAAAAVDAVKGFFAGSAKGGPKPGKAGGKRDEL